MSECSAMRESMPLLLTESLDAASREATHVHIESCAVCADEWAAMKETWNLLEELPPVEVPLRVREKFLAAIPAADGGGAVVVPFHRRRAAKWLAQAAAVVVIAGGSYFAGHRSAPVQLAPTQALLGSAQPVSQPIYSIAETRVLSAKSVSPNIEGRPDIENVQFVDSGRGDGQIGVAFDITSHMTVTGNPNDKSMVRLLAYVLQNADKSAPTRSKTIDWVRQTYSDPANADPEIAQALARVLRSDDHQGVRIRAIDTLNTMPAQSKNADQTRDALIEALRSDPNPAVRIKAVEALAKMASSGQPLNTAAVDMLRLKASQDDENLYVRVKAAEALSKLRP